MWPLALLIKSLAAHVLPWTALGLACLAVSTVMQGRSMQREADAASARMKEEKAARIKIPVGTPAPLKNQTAVRLIILAVAVVFILVGIRNGSISCRWLPQIAQFAPAT